MAGALEVLGDDAVVADEGIGLHDDLPGVAGVGQGLYVTAHAGGEDQLADGPAGVRAEPKPLEDLAVRQYQIAFFHRHLQGPLTILISFIMMGFALSVNDGMPGGRRSFLRKGITFC